MWVDSRDDPPEGGRGTRGEERTVLSLPVCRESLIRSDYGADVRLQRSPCGDPVTP
jgi:hypothetical protein